MSVHDVLAGAISGPRGSRVFGRLFGLLVVFLLGFCLVFSVLYVAGYCGVSFFVLVNRSMTEFGVVECLFSAGLDFAVWGFMLFVVLGWLVMNVTSRGLERFSLGSLVLLVVGVLGVVLVGFVLEGAWFLILLSWLLVGFCAVFSKALFGVSWVGLVKRLLLSVFVLVLVIEVGALFLVNVPGVLGLSFDGVGGWGLVELSFSNVFYPVLPFAYLFWVFLGIVCFVVRVVPLGWLSGGFARLGRFVSGLHDVFRLREVGGFGFLDRRYVMLSSVVVSVVVCCLFVVFTLLPSVNPTHMLVSVDAPDYYQWIENMRSVDVGSAFSFAFTNDRALFLVLAYVLSFVLGSVGVVQVIAGLLIVLFGIVCLLVLRVLCGLRDVWVLGVLLVPFSFQALGLIYAGYFANMLALTFVFLYFFVFEKAWRGSSGLGVLGLLVLSVLVLFSHSWTWFVFALSLVGFLFLEWRSSKRVDGLGGDFKWKAVLVGATIGVGLVSDFARRFLSPVSSAASVFGTASSSLGFPNAGFVFGGLSETVSFRLGGVFANSLLVFLCVVGFLVLLRFRSVLSSFLVSWVFVACVSILFASAGFVFDRFLFLVPSVVLSALGLSFVVRFFAGGLRGRISLAVVALVLGFVFLLLLNGALRYVININVW